MLILIHGPSGSGKTLHLEQLYTATETGSRLVSHNKAFVLSSAPDRMKVLADTNGLQRTCKAERRRANQQRIFLEGQLTALREVAPTSDVSASRENDRKRWIQLKVASQLVQQVSQRLSSLKGPTVSYTREECAGFVQQTAKEYAYTVLKACPSCLTEYPRAEGAEADEDPQDILNALVQWTKCEQAVQAQTERTLLKQLCPPLNSIDEYSKLDKLLKQTDLYSRLQDATTAYNQAKADEQAYDQLFGILVQCERDYVQQQLATFNNRLNVLLTKVFVDPIQVELTTENIRVVSYRERNDIPLHKLSSGERARIIICCEIAVFQPATLFIDETLPSLDSVSLDLVLDMLREHISDRVYVAAHLPLDRFDEVITIGE